MINAISELTKVGVDRLAPAAKGSVSPPSGADFASMLAEVTVDAIGTVKRAESVVVANMKREGPTVQQAVEAIMSAERTMQAAISIRDRIVSAYQELSRMSI